MPIRIKNESVAEKQGIFKEFSTHFLPLFYIMADNTFKR